MKTATSVALYLLFAVEVFTAFQPTEHNFQLLAGLMMAFISTAPLLVIIAAVRKGSRPLLAGLCAWVSIVVGSVMQYDFHTSHDPSKILVLAVSIFTYWLCAFIALFSFGSKRP